MWEWPLYAQVAVGVAAGLVLWATLRWMWTKRGSLGQLPHILAPLVVLPIAVPLSLFVAADFRPNAIAGWLQFALSFVAAYGLFSLCGFAKRDLEYPGFQPGSEERVAHYHAIASWRRPRGAIGLPIYLAGAVVFGGFAFRLLVLLNGNEGFFWVWN